MPTRNVNLTEHFDRFIEFGIASGRFGMSARKINANMGCFAQIGREP